MKNLFKTLLALTLATTFVLTGCEKDDWQTVSCDVSVYEGSIYEKDGEMIYSHLLQIYGPQTISFKLPKEFYQVEDEISDVYWTDGNEDAKKSVKVTQRRIVDTDNYRTYQEQLKEPEYTALENCTIYSSKPVRAFDADGKEIDLTKQGIRIHNITAITQDGTIHFQVDEQCPPDAPLLSEETKELIQSIADSFEYTPDIVIGESDFVTYEDIEFASKLASSFGILHNVGLWDNAEEIPVNMYLAWYKERADASTFSKEEIEESILEKYPDGFVYHQKDFETLIQEYFDVSTEYLRSYDGYHAEDELYHLEAGGTDLKYRVELGKKYPKVEGDIIYAYLQLSWSGNFDDTEYRTLVIQRTDPYYGFKFLRVTD